MAKLTYVSTCTCVFFCRLVWLYVAANFLSQVKGCVTCMIVSPVPVVAWKIMNNQRRLFLCRSSLQQRQANLVSCCAKDNSFLISPRCRVCLTGCRGYSKRTRLWQAFTATQQHLQRYTKEKSKSVENAKAIQRYVKPCLTACLTA